MGSEKVRNGRHAHQRTRFIKLSNRPGYEENVLSELSEVKSRLFKSHYPNMYTLPLNDYQVNQVMKAITVAMFSKSLCSRLQVIFGPKYVYFPTQSNKVCFSTETLKYSCSTHLLPDCMSVWRGGGGQTAVSRRSLRSAKLGIIRQKERGVITLSSVSVAELPSCLPFSHRDSAH